MSSDSQQIDSVGPSRGALVVVAVIMGLCILGSPNLNAPRDTTFNEITFGAPCFPTIAAVEEAVVIEELGGRIESPPGWTCYKVVRGPRNTKPVSIVMINRTEAMVGEITGFDSDAERWPPEISLYGETTQRLDFESIEQDRDAGVDVDGPLAGVIEVDPIRTNVVKWDGGEIEWSCAAVCRTWPHRTHIGRIDLGNRVLLVTLRELHAKVNPPDYQAAPFVDVVKAIRRTP